MADSQTNTAISRNSFKPVFNLPKGTRQISYTKSSPNNAVTIEQVDLLSKRIEQMENLANDLDIRSIELDKKITLSERLSNNLYNFVLIVVTGVLIALSSILIPLAVTYNHDESKVYRELINQNEILKARVNTMELLISK